MHKLTPLSEVGEFGLIDRIHRAVSLEQPSSLLGIGDDAAIIKTQKHTVITTDILLEGIHFDLVYTPLKHLGYKAVMVNLSDICAMNAKPTQILVSLGMSKRFSLEAVDELYEGILLACKKYQVDLVGGDTSSSMTGLTINITAVGEVEEAKICKRSGAKETDLICLSGDLGAAYLGFQLLEREKKVFEVHPNMQPEFKNRSYLLSRFLRPEARVDVVQNLEQADIVPTSMIDISDGLASEIIHICKASHVGARIYLDKLPISRDSFDFAEELNIDPVTAAMNGGEDYELLFTVPLALHERIKDIGGIDVIGHITRPDQGVYLVPPQGDDLPITAQGFNHLSNPDSHSSHTDSHSSNTDSTPE